MGPWAAHLCISNIFCSHLRIGVSVETELIRLRLTRLTHVRFKVGNLTQVSVLGQMLVSSSQWIFPVSALHETPSIRISHIPLERELYDRSRGVEFLFRLGSTLLMFVRSCVKFARCPDVFQAVVGYGHGCNLVSPVLHALLYGRLFKTGTLAHNMLNVIS